VIESRASPLIARARSAYLLHWWYDQGDEMNGYIAFYKGKRTEVYAETLYGAQLEAAKFFGAKKSYEVIVGLAEKDGVPVVHRAVD
jgi:hypothetical protein